MGKIIALGLLVLGVLGLSLTFWLRSGNTPRPEEQDSSALAQSHSQPHSGRPGASGNRVRLRELPTAAPENRELERFRTAVLAAQALEDPMEQAAAWDRLMEGMTKETAATLLASLSPEELKGEAGRRLFDHWATTDPGEAAAWAQGQDDPETRQLLLNVAALRWTATDLSEAAIWARSLPEGASREEIMATVASEAVRSDPLEALRLGVELPAGTAQEDLISRAAAEWAVTDPENAAKWAEQISDVDLRQRVTGQVVVASAEQDPVGAATIALQQMAPGGEQDRAVVSIVQRWVQTDPEGASAWVREFPEGALGRDAMDNLVNLWADRDLVTSGNWLLGLPAGAMQNAGILAYSHKLQRTDPELARRWMLSVTDSQ